MSGYTYVSGALSYPFAPYRLVLCVAYKLDLRSADGSLVEHVTEAEKRRLERKEGQGRGPVICAPSTLSGAFSLREGPPLSNRWPGLLYASEHWGSPGAAEPTPPTWATLH